MKYVLHMVCLVALLMCLSVVGTAQGRYQQYRVRAIGGPLASVQADGRVSVNQLYNVRDIHGCVLEPEDADNYPYAFYVIPVGTKPSGSKTHAWLTQANQEWKRKTAMLKAAGASASATHKASPTPTPTVAPSPTPSVVASPSPAVTATPYLPAQGQVTTSKTATGIYFALQPTIHMQMGERRNIYYVVGYGSQVRAEPVLVTVRSLLLSGTPVVAGSPPVSPAAAGSSEPQESVTVRSVEPGVVLLQAVHPGAAEVRLETLDRAILASVPVVVAGDDASYSSLFNTVLLWLVLGVCVAAAVWGVRTYWVRYRHQP